MSLRINKNNIFFILPEDRYSVSKRIDGYMANDFSLYVKAKINIDYLETDKEYFVLARNGMHSGISVYKDSLGGIIIIFAWWMQNEDGIFECKNLTSKIDDKFISEHNEYIMTCDENKKEMYCFFNREFIGTISYKDCKKQTYENAFYWFGCGSMMCDEENRRAGDFDFDLSFLLNKKIEINQITDIVDNYKEKYTVDMFDGLKKLKNDYELKDNFAFFCDFDNSTKYKVWDMTFSGNYPQIYIEDNIYF